jgi:hypothetical protein
MKHKKGESKMPNFEKMLEMQDAIVTSAQGAELGEFLSALCTSLEIICDGCGADVVEVSKNMYESIATVNEFIGRLAKED